MLNHSPLRQASDSRSTISLNCTGFNQFRLPCTIATLDCSIKARGEILPRSILAKSARVAALQSDPEPLLSSLTSAFLFLSSLWKNGMFICLRVEGVEGMESVEGSESGRTPYGDQNLDPPHSLQTLHIVQLATSCSYNGR